MNNSENMQLCKNELLCKSGLLPMSHLYNGLCHSCFIHWKQPLQIYACEKGNKCDICCLDVSYMMVFPSGCNHSFCLRCIRNRTHNHYISFTFINPLPFGCPPCPNHHYNGKKILDDFCCDEWNNIYDDWFHCCKDSLSQIYHQINDQLNKVENKFDSYMETNIKKYKDFCPRCKKKIKVLNETSQTIS